MNITPGAQGADTRAGSAPWACSHRVPPSADCRHATAEYGTASGAHPVDSTVAVTTSPARVGAEIANEHGGGGGAGAAWATTPPAASAPADTIGADTIEPNTIQTRRGPRMDRV